MIDTVKDDKKTPKIMGTIIKEISQTSNAEKNKELSCVLENDEKDT